MRISKEMKAGAIAVLAIVAFMVMFQFMRGKNLFITDNVYYVTYDNVEGLKRSSEVSINGLKVGQVDEIIPKTDDNGKIYFLVKMLVNPDFTFSKNSTVEITDSGLMSPKILSINVVYGNPIAQNGDTLQSSKSTDPLKTMANEIAPLSSQLKTVLKTVDSLGVNANKVFDDRNRQQIVALLINLNQAVSALQGTIGYTNSLVRNNDPRLQSVLTNADKAMINANTAIGKYGALAESVDTQQLNRTIANLDITVNKLNNLVNGIEKGEGTLGKVIKDEKVYRNLEETTGNLNKLILDIQNNPKRYVNFSVFGKNSK